MKEVAVYSVPFSPGWLLLGLLLLVVLLVFVLRLGVLACYDKDGPWVKVRVGPKYIQVYPLVRDPDKEAKKRRKKEAQAAKKALKAEKQAAKKAVREAKHPPAPQEKRTVGGVLALVWDLLPVVQETVGRFRRKLQIDDLTIAVTWAQEDPADTGARYGYGCAVLEALVTFLEKNFVIQRRHTALQVDFLAE